MNKIVAKSNLSENVVKLTIAAPEIANKREAGHFVMVKIGKEGERIPLTISQADKKAGTISLIIQKVGTTSHKVCNMEVGEYITDVVGPLGNATTIENYGTVLCAGGGVGIAPLLPIVEALKAAGNHIISVLGARSSDLIILENEISQVSDELIIMTDDGSKGERGLITEGMERAIKANRKIDLSFTIGPAVMMKYCSMLTKKYEIPTIASLNTIMVDGTGMCGACRVTVGGSTKFVCIDGPEFNAHEVNFDELLLRLSAYTDEESANFKEYSKQMNR